MKIRSGFVSNSSSSSFITESYDSVFDVAVHMMAQNDAWKPHVRGAHIKRINDARAFGVDADTPVVFTSWNYDTNIVRDGDRILIATCNNTSWDISHSYATDDFVDDEYDKIRVATKWCIDTGIYGTSEYADAKHPCKCGCGYKMFISGVTGNQFCAACQVDLTTDIPLKFTRDDCIVIGTTANSAGVLTDNITVPGNDVYVYVIYRRPNGRVVHILVDSDSAFHTVKFGKYFAKPSPRLKTEEKSKIIKAVKAYVS